MEVREKEGPLARRVGRATLRLILKFGMYGRRNVTFVPTFFGFFWAEFKELRESFEHGNWMEHRDNYSISPETAPRRVGHWCNG